jgi:hypothetical protein
MFRQDASVLDAQRKITMLRVLLIAARRDRGNAGALVLDATAWRPGEPEKHWKARATTHAVRAINAAIRFTTTPTGEATDADEAMPHVVGDLAICAHRKASVDVRCE